jgi:small neutral amino acid transporter SnatA (MarC family)
MPKRTRFALAFAVLLAALLALTLVAVGGLLTLQLHGAAIAAAVAGGVAVAAVAAGHAVLRELPEAPKPEWVEEPQPNLPSRRCRRACP